MRQCKRINEMMSDAVYGQLPDKEQKVFRDHLDACPHCAREFNNLKYTLATMDAREHPEMGDDFWNGFYHRLEEKIDHTDIIESKQRRKQIRLVQSPNVSLPSADGKRNWLVYTVAAAAFLLVAIGAGVYLTQLQQKQEESFANTTAAILDLTPAVNDHFESVKPVLVDYANYTPSKPVLAVDRTDTKTGQPTDGRDELVTIEKSAIKKLLLENQMLKRTMAKQKNISTRQLLEELEVILVELENGDEDPETTRQLVKELILEYDILFKMDVYKNKKKQTTLSPTTSL